jgi:creatinine amidohydrolase
MNRMLTAILAVLGLPALAAAQQPATREMNDLNWMEFRELVPARIRTVILTVGTLEPHGVINNGADNTAPVALARELAPKINALIAPHIPYGVTGSMAAYPGAFEIPPEAFRAYVRAVLEGLARNRFRNIIILNGHGGQQTSILEQEAAAVAAQRGVNTLVVNWWAVAADASRAVFGQDGGHAGINETAFIQAVDPHLVHRELYRGPEMATPVPAPGTWAAWPFPSSITLYTPGQGWPTDFDQKKAEEYYRQVVERVTALVTDTLHKWELAGFE